MLVLIGIIVGIMFFGLFTVFIGAPYVPTHRKQVQVAFDTLRPINKNDVVIDLGSGDGVVLREVSKRGARAIGVELSPIMLIISKILSVGNPRITIEAKNIWKYRLPDDATVVYAFIVSRDSVKFSSYLQKEATRLRRTLDVITYGSVIDEKRVVKRKNAHILQKFEPLQ